MRHFASLLVVLSLMLGTSVSASRASCMAEMVMGMAQAADQSTPDNCPECQGAAKVANCAKLVCGVFSAVLAGGHVLLARGLSHYALVADGVESRLPRFLDPPPPRTVAIG